MSFWADESSSCLGTPKFCRNLFKWHLYLEELRVWFLQLHLWHSTRQDFLLEVTEPCAMLQPWRKSCWAEGTELICSVPLTLRHCVIYELKCTDFTKRGGKCFLKGAKMPRPWVFLNPWHFKEARLALSSMQAPLFLWLSKPQNPGLRPSDVSASDYLILHHIYDHSICGQSCMVRESSQ